MHPPWTSLCLTNQSDSVGIVRVFGCLRAPDRGAIPAREVPESNREFVSICRQISAAERNPCANCEDLDGPRVEAFRRSVPICGDWFAKNVRRSPHGVPRPAGAVVCPGTGAILCLVYLLRVTSISRAAVVLVLLCPLLAVACRTYGIEPPATLSDAGGIPSDSGLVDRLASESGRFCEKQTNAVYCADFDGPDFGFGWELRGEDLGRLVRVASTKSLPFALRAELNLPATSPSDAGLVGNVYLLHKLGQPFPGICLLYTSPSPRDRTRSRMPSSA